MTQGSNSALCDDLEGWDGEGGREGQQGEDTCVPVPDSC